MHITQRPYRQQNAVALVVSHIPASFLQAAKFCWQSGL